jgi:hypothetical protein
LDKLAFLLDIRMDALVDLKNQYDSIRDVEVEVVNDDYKVEVSQEPFIRYTENEEENERVIRGNNLIKALELISKYVQIYPLTIQQATSNYLTFDMRTQTYKINL